ncbi:GrpB family protein [Bombella apis]|uniref:GrpB family protein n=1 Tax=Bombella apis TaxID=1785988 RepID=A0ABR9MNR3_9PROT|nr:GrpB family protein [Bombella apis]MBE1723503.1 GrpB family protein [Bombella apis]MBR9730284.1 GrpB family protein [Bombella apis]
MNEPITDQLNAIEIMTFEDGDPNENPWVADKPKQEDISVEPYSPEWVAVFKSQREKIAHALGEAALAIEHVGSTAVLGLPAKPVIDIDLIVNDPNEEEAYIPALTRVGYELTVRERSWYQHRMLRLEHPRVNLHVFGPNCPEHIRHRLFRDWLREHSDDRQLYTDAKIAAKHDVNTAHDYNKNKQEAVRHIYQRIFISNGWIARPGP